MLSEYIKFQCKSARIGKRQGKNNHLGHEQELETCYKSKSPLVKVYFQQKMDYINPCKLLNDKHLGKVFSML